MYHEPWGSSATTALRWAYGCLAETGAIPSLLGHLREGSRPKNELTALELRAQAAQIRALVERLDDRAGGAYLAAFYLPRSARQLRGGGKVVRVDQFAQERHAAVRVVAGWLLRQAGTGVHRIRGYQEVVMQHCYGNGSIRRLAALWKMDTNAVAEKREECRSRLRELHTRAHSEVDNRLYDAGLI